MIPVQMAIGVDRERTVTAQTEHVEHLATERFMAPTTSRDRMDPTRQIMVNLGLAGSPIIGNADLA